MSGTGGAADEGLADTFARVLENEKVIAGFQKMFQNLFAAEGEKARAALAADHEKLVTTLRSELTGVSAHMRTAGQGKVPGRKMGQKPSPMENQRNAVYIGLKEWAGVLYQQNHKNHFRAVSACQSAARSGQNIAALLVNEDREGDAPPSQTIPWLAEAFWGRRGKTGEDYDQDAGNALEVATSESIRSVVTRMLQRLVIFFLFAREHAAKERCNHPPIAGAPKPQWASFGKDGVSLCEAALVQLTSEDPKGTHTGSQVHTNGMRLVTALLNRLLEFQKSDLISELTSSQSPDQPDGGGSKRTLGRQQTLNKVMETAVMRGAWTLMSKGERVGAKRLRSESAPDSRNGSVSGGKLEPDLELLGKFAGHLCGQMRTHSTECRKAARDEFWCQLGFPVYCVVRGRPGWKIVLRNERNTTSFAGTGVQLGMTTENGRKVPAAQCVEPEQTLGPDFPADTDDEGGPACPGKAARDAFFAGRKGKGKKNQELLRDMSANFPYLTLELTFPVKPVVDELNEDDVKDLADQVAKFNKVIGNTGAVNSATDKNQLSFTFTRKVDLHQLALSLLMKWADVADETAFLTCCRESLRAVHAVALSLFAAVRLALEDGKVEDLNPSEKLFLGNLRFFQVTKSTTKGACESLNSRPGLASVTKMPYEDRDKEFDNESLEDRSFMNGQVHEAHWGNKKKSWSARDDAIMLRRVPVDDFRTMMDEILEARNGQETVAGSHAAVFQADRSESSDRRSSANLHIVPGASAPIGDDDDDNGVDCSYGHRHNYSSSSDEG